MLECQLLLILIDEEVAYLLQQFINLMQYKKAGNLVLLVALVVSAFDFISANNKKVI